MDINLEPFFKDFGIDIYKGSFRFIGILDNNDKDTFERATVNTLYLRTKTIDVATVNEKDILQIQSLDYKVIKKYKWLDGRFTILEVHKI